jgi:phospholipid transport system substrate-binding protein
VREARTAAAREGARRRRAAHPLALALVLATLGAAPSDDPLPVVRQALASAKRLVASEGTREEKLESLRELARELVDSQAMGRRALQRVLSAQEPEAQREFFDLFGEFIVRAYLQRLLFFRDPEFGFGRPRVEGEAVLVKTRIITRKDDYYVDYEMHRNNGRWMAADIVVEGVSLADNYGEQFESVLRNRSFEELLDLMRRKLHRLRESDDS